MPSNNAFKKEIDALAKELDIDVGTDGLNNNQLAAFLKDLRGKKSAAETVTQADKAEVDKAEADKVAADKVTADKVAADKAEADKAEAESKPKSKDAYYLCEGKALTTRRGILSSGDEIKAEDISGGKEALDGFVETGHLEKG